VSDQITAEPRDRPILFSAPMVRAILAGAKTQTRRVLTSANSLVNGSGPCMRKDPRIIGAWSNLDFAAAWVDPGPSPAGNPGPYLKVPGGDESVHRVYSRVQVGDRLWVRETWRTFEREEDLVDGILFAADGAFIAIANSRDSADAWVEAHRRHSNWRPSIFMPRWASRITLDVTDVRIQRLQDISDADIEAEGVLPYVGAMRVNGEAAKGFITARYRFAGLWNAINGKRRCCAWPDNPWVIAVTFRRLEADR